MFFMYILLNSVLSQDISEIAKRDELKCYVESDLTNSVSRRVPNHRYLFSITSFTFLIYSAI